MKEGIFLTAFVRTWLLISLFGTVSVNLLSAGKIETRDGSVINGKILSIEAGVIKVETSYAGEISIKQSEVIVFSSEETINVSTDGGNTFKGTVAGSGDSIKIAANGGTFETSVSNVTAAWQPGEDSPIEKAHKAEVAANERKWKFDASVDISGKSGNSDRTATGIGASAVLESKKDRLGFYMSADIAEENGNTTSDEIKGGIDYSSFFSDSLSWYARGELEKDDIELLDIRTTAAFGIGKHVIRKDDQKLEFRGGLAYRFESFQNGTDVESPGLDLALIHFKDLGWGSMNNLVTYNPSFEDFGNFRVYHESSFDLPVGTGEFWKLRIGISNDYNSEPVAGLEELDTTYYTRLLLSWR
ncbi:MAG: DUF481 domain-containing protein [Verrucomicrobia bacterium]|nr:DUF481 domain-containing protein [Verrucomicrobiota bacterium]MDA1069716.1 DUF481 domain-containing protein [Verrucomicrobiota bacterium]